jgi:hypothetical protein
VESHLIESYKKPAVDPVSALAHRDQLVGPLLAFTEACRRERTAIMRHI